MSLPKTQKELIREHYMKKRLEMESDRWHRLSNTITKNIHSYIDSQIHIGRTSIWGGYAAVKNEVDITGVVSEYGPATPSLRWAFPRVGINEIEFCFISDIEEDLEKSRWGILEPRDRCLVVEKSQIEGICVPLVCFDQNGNRLGYGKGYYDRFLDNFEGRIIGIGFEIQRHMESLPTDTFDVPLDAVITERGFHVF